MLKSVAALFILLFAVNIHALEIFRTGSPKDVSTLTRQVICLAGGGNDHGWVGGWKQLLKGSHGGDILIVRADGRRGGYEEWIYHDKSKTDDERMGFPPVNSVTTLVLAKDNDANDSRAVEAVEQAEMIFFAGGSQTDYIKWFDHSLFGKALKTAVEVRRIPIAGTSAGMALLAGIRYRAGYTSPSTGGLLTANDILQDPTSVRADLDRNPIDVPYLKNIITETHFAQRSRQGRIVGFMANAIYTHLASVNQVKSISSDYGTAFCYDSKGHGEVFGFDNVFFMKPRGLLPEVMEKGKPLTWFIDSHAVEVQILRNGDRFRLSDWKVESDIPKAFTQFWSVHEGQLIRPADQPEQPDTSE